MKMGINLQHEDADDANKGGLALDVAKPELKRPSMYAIVMQNDDYTPMDFVVEVLQMFFSKTLEEATHIMLTVHTKGSAVCAIHTRDIAETKASQVNQYSKDSQHPLLCEIVPIGDNE